MSFDFDFLVNVPNIDFHNTTFNAGVSPKVSNEPN